MSNGKIQLKMPPSDEVFVHTVDGVYKLVQQSSDVKNPTFDKYVTSISAPLTSGGNGMIGTGLEYTEIKALLPRVIGVDSDDKEFNRSVQKWYRDLAIRVNQDGLRLNLKLASDGMPENILDYLRYRILLIHPKVANSENGVNNLVHKWFIKSDQQSQEVEYEKLKIRKKATAEYLNLAESKYAMYLTLLQVQQANKKTKQEQELALSAILEKNPQLFLDVHLDEKKQAKYFIYELVNYNIWSRLGNKIVHDNTTFASMDDAITYLNDSANRTDVQVLEQKLESIRGESLGFEAPKAKTTTRKRKGINES